MDASVTEPKPAESGAAIEVGLLSKRFKSVAAVDEISFAIVPGSITGLLGGNGAGKTTTIGMIMGLILPSSGSVKVLGQDMTRDRHRVLARMNFESPYVDMPHRLTVRQNLHVFAALYGLTDIKARIAELAAALALEELLDRPAGKALGRAEDARRTGQGARQRTGSPAARRADRLARSRHRRLDPHPSRKLPARAQCDDPARLA